MVKLYFGLRWFFGRDVFQDVFMTNRIAAIIAALSLSIVIGVATSMAAEPEVPTKLQVPILLKLLSYDRDLKRHDKVTLKIGVLFKAGSKESEDYKDDIMKFIDESKKLHGLNLRREAIPFTNTDDLVKKIEDMRIAVLVITPNMNESVEKIIGIGRWKNVTTLAIDPKYVERGAVAGIELAGKRPQIVINLESSKDHGCNFPAQLLKVARIIRK